jgi:hypothetical protein
LTQTAPWELSREAERRWDARHAESVVVASHDAEHCHTGVAPDQIIDLSVGQQPALTYQGFVSQSAWMAALFFLTEGKPPTI